MTTSTVVFGFFTMYVENITKKLEKLKRDTNEGKREREREGATLGYITELMHELDNLGVERMPPFIGSGCPFKASFPFLNRVDFPY